MWLESDQTEPHKLWDAGTFTPVDEVPAGHKVNGCKFVRTWKGNELGEVVKPKSRLVALGYSQTEHVDYFETFSPTPSPSSIKLLTKIAVEYDLPIYHLDVEQAFIRAEFDCDIYMRLPPAFREKNGQVVHLNKSLYGLKQAGRMFNALLVNVVVGYGLEQVKTDPCVFRLMKDETVTQMVAVHVDDLFGVGGAKEVAEFHDALNNKFPTKKVWELSWCTGCAFVRHFKDGTIKMSQTPFVQELLKRFENQCPTKQA